MRRTLLVVLASCVLLLAIASTTFAALPPRGSRFLGVTRQGSEVSFRVARHGELRLIGLDFGEVTATCPSGRPSHTVRLKTESEAPIDPDEGFGDNDAFTTGGEAMSYEGTFGTRHKASGLVSFMGRDDCGVSMSWRARSPFLRARPGRVAAGRRVRITGLVPIGCRDGATVTLISRAFSHRHDFAGLPAVYTTVRRGGGLAQPTRIPRGRRGRYRITARCGGGNLGVSARLHVVAPQ